MRIVEAYCMQFSLRFKVLDKKKIVELDKTEKKDICFEIATQAMFY